MKSKETKRLELIKLNDIKGDVFPAGRHSRILVGKDALQAENFVTGHSTIFPGGRVPMHAHKNEEVYVILSGRGKMVVGDEAREVEGVSAVYIPSNVEHSLTNTGDENMEILYVYSPAGIVDHWEQERTGNLK